MESAVESANSENRVEYTDSPETIYLDENGGLPQTVQIKEEPRDYSDDATTECAGCYKFVI